MERNKTIIKRINGNNVAFVNEIMFTGRQNIKWDDVEAYLKQYVGKAIEIVDSKELIYIGSDLPDEYTGKSKGKCCSVHPRNN